MEMFAAIISVIVVIVFLVMAVNISSIKDLARQSDATTAMVDYLILKQCSNNAATYEALLRFIYLSIFNSDNRQREYRRLKLKYENAVTALGYTFPEFPPEGKIN